MSFDLRLIRCGLGQHPTHLGFQVEAQHAKDKAKQVFTIASINTIPLAWHQEGRAINYGFNFAIRSNDGIPAGLDPNDYNEIVLEVAAAIAAQKLNRELNLGHDVFESTGGSGDHVTVRAFWEDATSTCSSMTALGCFTQVGFYPHLSPHTMNIRYPPTNMLTPKANVTKWTDNPNDVKNANDRRQFFFLPAVIAHEFGHALGVLHLPGGHLMGTHTQGTIWNNTPTQNDLDGFLETLQVHGHQ